jgi:hypothetical protein
MAPQEHPPAEQQPPPPPSDAKSPKSMPSPLRPDLATNDNVRKAPLCPDGQSALSAEALIG